MARNFQRRTEVLSSDGRVSVQFVWRAHRCAVCVKGTPVCSLCEGHTGVQFVWRAHRCAVCVKGTPVCSLCEGHTGVQFVWRAHRCAVCVKGTPVCGWTGTRLHCVPNINTKKILRFPFSTAVYASCVQPFLVPVPPDVISLQLCTARVVSV
jgi:hypothetical protein